MTVDELAGLRDVHLPPAPWFWSMPDWVLAALLLLLVLSGWAGLRFLRRPLLRAAMRDIALIEYAYAQDRNASRLVRNLSRLLRRYAAARFPQSGIEGLTGGEWAGFLVAHGRGFDAGMAELLAVRPYQAQGDVDAALLVQQVRRWLKVNPQ